MSEWKTVCAVDDIPVQGARRVQREAGPQVAVFRAADDRVFALLDRCPHKGGPLSQGIVFGHSVACPLHNWTIALDSGEAQAPDVGCAVRFEVRLVEGQVLLNQIELDTLAIDLPALVAGPCSKVA
ncbi:nitrite reductase small subunit NirD [Roseateles toxinivorans]|uniref:Assimilatory nitrite reductase (NAD(P)H) small subunit n=1 Tax=Roseateles toxinivorans TaxID=270368 RepID=A0A4R6QSQ6_9BURK|nr:nitrite reductase small subunit NirD [Roseateles toxinivorans]TDP73305.1 assimilatory nitrite reductase (NAD(P)H) small subunit [Roseateles toxinivorans]